MPWQNISIRGIIWYYAFILRLQQKFDFIHWGKYIE